MDSFCAMSSTNTPLLDTIRRTIEDRNLLTARSRLKYVSALKRACLNDKTNLETTVASRIEKHKTKVVKELVSSEKTYLKQIGWIVSGFKLTLEVHSALTRKDMDILFGNIELIKTLNEELYKDLLGSNENVAKTFANFAPMLKIYSAYARNYQQGIETLQSVLSNNLAAASIIIEIEQRLNTKLPALLIAPIQRIPRYKLLLEHLMSFSKAEERLEIQGPLEAINEVANHMNEMVRSFENSQKILHIQKYFKKKLKLELVKPGRVLVKNGIVAKPPKGHRRYVILFSDFLYFCKMKSGKKIKLHSPLIVPLRKCIVNLNGETIMIHFEGETPVKFTVSDPDELQEWHDEITATIKALKRRSATLRKDSSKSRPVFLGRGGTPLRSQNDTPGRLKRSFNISACLDEIVDFLTPKKKQRTAV